MLPGQSAWQGLAIDRICLLQGLWLPVSWERRGHGLKSIKHKTFLNIKIPASSQLRAPRVPIQGWFVLAVCEARENVFFSVSSKGLLWVHYIRVLTLILLPRAPPSNHPLLIPSPWAFGILHMNFRKCRQYRVVLTMGCTCHDVIEKHLLGVNT